MSEINHMTNALTIPSISGLDSLDQYMRTIKSFPVLSAEEEYNYAKRLKENNDLEAAKGLIISHLRLVASIARGYSGYGLPQADLIQEGNVGLMKAVKRFDPERGVRLVSFAIHWIKAEIHEYIVRNWRLVKLATTKAQRKLFFNLRSMKTGEGSLKPDQVARIARELKVKPEEVLEMESRMGGHEISLENNSDDDEDDKYSPIAYLQDTQLDPLEKLAETQNDHLQTEGLALALESLDERSRRIVHARWLQEDSNVTLHDLAAEYGVSAERIRQIEQKAMQKMKGLLSEVA
jgi:RNA polymerase sigma-32 factor